MFLSERARETDDNLLFVRERLLRSGQDVPALLELYARIWAGKRVAPGRANPLTDLLRLAGLVRLRGEWLGVRNRIYATVFDREWVRASMPDAEQRRQRAAYRRGV
ncbi:MAG: hypothetical protein FJX77_17030, partial [Armatimonadetes bacterium]|nr:hypothetical protein [Armatimonadota bacterium]